MVAIGLSGVELHLCKSGTGALTCPAFSPFSLPAAADEADEAEDAAAAVGEKTEEEGEEKEVKVGLTY